LSELAWGRRYLMCPPIHYDVLYEINPWMRREVAVDAERARSQWESLRATLVAAGAGVERMEAAPGLPDLVFTANAGLVDGERFVCSRFRHPERAPEAALDAAWFASRGFDVLELPEGVYFEGAGDALPFADRFLAGYRIRSDFAAHGMVSKLLGAESLAVELVDPRFYHLDLAFCPLDSERAMIAPDAIDAYGRAVVQRLVPQPLVLELDEALSFCANSLVIGRTVVMSSCPPRVGRELERWGFDLTLCPVDEFLKAGGGPRCLTLALDVRV
jgi:N-dimethylarginine dimethylaminohydrolase